MVALENISWASSAYQSDADVAPMPGLCLRPICWFASGFSQGKIPPAILAPTPYASADVAPMPGLSLRPICWFASGSSQFKIPAVPGLVPGTEARPRDGVGGGAGWRASALAHGTPSPSWPRQCWSCSACPSLDLPTFPRCAGSGLPTPSRENSLAQGDALERSKEARCALCTVGDEGKFSGAQCCLLSFPNGQGSGAALLPPALPSSASPHWPPAYPPRLDPVSLIL